MILHLTDVWKRPLMGHGTISLFHQQVRSASRVVRDVELDRRIKIANLERGIYTGWIRSDYYLPYRWFATEGGIVEQNLLIHPQFADGLRPINACWANVYALAKRFEIEKYIGFPLELCPDRVFFTATALTPALLEHSHYFEPAPDLLHKHEQSRPLGSWKSTRLDTPLQVTLYPKGIAELDIDIHRGVRHMGEVIWNAVSGSKTDPYVVGQLLVVQGVDPGYRLEVRV